MLPVVDHIGVVSMVIAMPKESPRFAIGKFLILENILVFGSILPKVAALSSSPLGAMPYNVGAESGDEFVSKPIAKTPSLEMCLVILYPGVGGVVLAAQL
jgi:hypothetical protein